MGTEVLYPQDILGERFRVCQPVFHGRKSFFVNGSGFGNVKSNNHGYRKQLNHLPQRLDSNRKSPSVQQLTKQQLNSTPRRTVVVDLENHHLNRSLNHQHEQLQQLQNHLNSSSRRTVVDLENYHLYRSSNHQQQQLQNHPNSIPRRTVVDFENHHLNRCSNHQQQLQNRVEIGQVTVLRRGRSLDSLEAKRNKRNSNIKTKEEISIKNRLNLECGYGESLYAGPAFHSSPAPESLPLPSFFPIKDNKDKNSKKDKYDESAGRDLRRLLRLE